MLVPGSYYRNGRQSVWKGQPRGRGKAIESKAARLPHLLRLPHFPVLKVPGFIDAMDGIKACINDDNQHRIGDPMDVGWNVLLTKFGWRNPGLRKRRNCPGKIFLISLMSVKQSWRMQTNEKLLFISFLFIPLAALFYHNGSVWPKHQFYEMQDWQQSET